jgi:hypothetical protein
MPETVDPNVAPPPGAALFKRPDEQETLNSVMGEPLLPMLDGGYHIDLGYYSYYLTAIHN